MIIQEYKIKTKDVINNELHICTSDLFINETKFYFDVNCIEKTEKCDVLKIIFDVEGLKSLQSALNKILTK